MVADDLGEIIHELVLGYVASLGETPVASEVASALIHGAENGGEPLYPVGKGVIGQGFVLLEDGGVPGARHDELVGSGAAEDVVPLQLPVIGGLLAGGVEVAVDGIGVSRLQAVVPAEAGKYPIVVAEVVVQAPADDPLRGKLPWSGGETIGARGAGGNSGKHSHHFRIARIRDGSCILRSWRIGMGPHIQQFLVHRQRWRLHCGYVAERRAGELRRWNVGVL